MREPCEPCELVRALRAYAPCDPAHPLRASALRACALPGGDGGPALSRELQRLFGVIYGTAQGVIIGE
jgi:hypothetical protein